MKRGNNESVSIWQNTVNNELSFQPLRDNLEADVCIVGAGIAGLTTGYLLAREGKSVVIVDAWEMAAGETGRTTAHLTAVLDDRFFNIESLFGEKGARLAAESHMAAINHIEAIIRKENINCDFERVDGYLAPLDEKQREDFDKEVAPVKQAGFSDMEIVGKLPISGLKINLAMRFPQQATLHITNYMNGLAEAFMRLGGQIYTNSRIVEVKGGDNAYAKTNKGYKVNAKNIVVATNTPINDWVKMHTKQAAYRTYVIGYQISKDTYPGFLLWDMADPYHYVRIVRGNSYDTLIVGGEDHKTGQAYDMDLKYQKLDNWAKNYFTTLGPITYRWSGQVMEPVDCMAFIGRNPMDSDNVYIATGDSGNGMTHGTIAGILITDLIMGRNNEWQSLYDPARKSVKAATTFIKENANFVGHMVKDWVKPGEVDSVDAISRGEGAILRKGVSKIAVYRDKEGKLHERSAVCTHLGCVVQWNRGEKSWDCPCHGSRFDCEGHILNGPAIKPLAEVKADSSHEVAA